MITAQLGPFDVDILIEALRNYEAESEDGGTTTMREDHARTMHALLEALYPQIGGDKWKGESTK